MILNALVYTVVEKVSFWDELLNILTALGTVGAVILSLYFSNEEKRAKKAEEMNNNEIIREVIYSSLNNSLERILKYREVVDRASLSQNGRNTRFIYYTESERVRITTETDDIVSLYLERNLDKDILFISTQLSVLKELGIKSVTLKWIKIYYQATSDLYLLEKSLEEISSKSNLDERNGYFYGHINTILSPLEKLVNEIEATQSE